MFVVVLASLATAAFDDSHHSGFVFAARARDSSLARSKVHVPSLAADESFVGLNCSKELLRS